MISLRSDYVSICNDGQGKGGHKTWRKVVRSKDHRWKLKVDGQVFDIDINSDT